MNDEIKEIKDLVLYYAKDDEDYKRSVALFNVGKIEKILDYITNLQQENEHKDFQIDHLGKVCDALQQGNKRLKEKLEARRKICLEVVKREQDYKSRCEKAIKYIDTNFCIENRRDLKELVNILQNGSDGQ